MPKNLAHRGWLAQIVIGFLIGTHKYLWPGRSRSSSSSGGGGVIVAARISRFHSFAKRFYWCYFRISVTNLKCYCYNSVRFSSPITGFRSSQKRIHWIRFDAALVQFSVAVCSFLVWIQLLTFHILFTQTDNGSFSSALCAKLCKCASVTEWAHDVIKNLIINLNIAKAIYSINYNGDAIILMEKPREMALWISVCLSHSFSLCVCLIVCSKWQSHVEHFMKWISVKIHFEFREIIATILHFHLNECFY